MVQIWRYPSVWLDVLAKLNVTLQHALNLFDEATISEIATDIWIGLAAIAHARGNYADALEHLNHGLSNARESRDQTGCCDVLDNIAHIHLAKGELGSAMEILEESLQTRKSLGDRTGESRTLNSISQSLRRPRRGTTFSMHSAILSNNRLTDPKRNWRRTIGGRCNAQ